MAEGFANHYGGDVLIASSAGLSPTQGVAPETVAVMREVNVDISRHVPSRYEPLAVAHFDIVVNMSGYTLPGKAPKELLSWQVEDPYMRPADVYLRVRADLEQRVMHLILRLRREAKAAR